MERPNFAQTMNRSILKTSMDRADCKALFAGARRKVFNAGQTIFSAGEAGDTVIMIESGRVEISVTSLGGRKSVLAQMGPTEVLGEIAALDGGTRSADAVAVGAVSGLVLSRQNILSFVADRPKVAQAIIAELCRKVRNASDMFSIQSVPEGGPRLATALLRLFERWGKADADGAMHLNEPFSQSEIGEFSGLARENVNRHLKAWSKQGIVRSDKEELVLLDPFALEDIAAGTA